MSTHSNETAAKPYGDPDNDTIAIPRKSLEEIDPSSLVGMTVVSATDWVERNGYECHVVDPAVQPQPYRLGVAQVFLLVEDNNVVSAGRSYGTAIDPDLIFLGRKKVEANARRLDEAQGHRRIAHQTKGDWKSSDLVVPPEKRDDQPMASDKPLTMRSGPVGSGVPNQYPLSMGSMPFDRAYLRPLQQPLYDAEWYEPHQHIRDLDFFCRAVDRPFAHSLTRKTMHDTNLNQDKMLDYPREFSILGFKVTLDPRTSLADREALVSSGATFMFTFSGNRPYLRVPLTDVCEWRPSERSAGDILAAHEMSETMRLSPEEIRGSQRQPEQIMQLVNERRFYQRPKTRQEEKDVVEEKDRKMINLAVKLLENASVGKKYYPFNMGRSALKIKPGEEFMARLSWQKPPFVSKPVRIVTEIVGLLWQPL